MPPPATPTGEPTLAPLFIHIGAHKAGSSTIQYFLQEREEALAGRGVLYPALGRSPNGAHHDFANTLREGSPDRDHALWAEVRRLRAAPAATRGVVLSTENFETLKRRAIERLPDLVGGGAVTIIAYLRDVAGAVVSAYGQRTKIGVNLLDFDRFFDRFMEREGGRRLDVLRAWAAVFGAANVRIRLLHPDGLVGGDLVLDVLDAIGCPADGLDAGAAARRNVSPGWKATETLRAVMGHVAHLTATDAGDDDRKVVEQLRRSVQAAAAEAGLAAERGEYLTAAQRRLCDRVTAEQAEAINALLPGHALRAAASGDAAAERPFLPSVEHVPSAELAKLMAHAAVLLARRAPPRPGRGTARAARDQLPPDVLEMRRARRAQRKRQLVRQAG